MRWQINFTRFFKMLLTAFAGLEISSFVLYGQESVSSYAQPTLIKTLQICPPGQSLAFPFWVDQTTSFSVTVSSLIKNLGIQLIDPNGATYVFGQQPTANFESNIYPDPLIVPDAPGANYYLNVETPAKGQWSLAINTPSVQSSLTSIPLQINFNNQVAPVIFGGGGSSPMGSNISFGMAVVDGGNYVGNLQISAMLFRSDAPSIPPVLVTFADDGQGADYISGDLIYSVYVTPPQPGSYMLQVEVSGEASTGHFQRSISSGFKVTPPNGSVTGNFTVKPRVGSPK